MPRKTKNITQKPETAQTFQVNLAGMIELLAHHLYSGTHVYLRELLQNAADAIQARQNLGDSTRKAIVVEIIGSRKDVVTLVFEDNGIGLTEAEVHQFLATIGMSSKRDELARRRGDFIGQFGIGLLSAFMVTDEIVLITQSAKPGNPTIEWRGKADGTYTLRHAATTAATPGTKVYLQAKPDALECFSAAYVCHHLRHFGAALPWPIEFVCKDVCQRLNDERPAWLGTNAGSPAWRSGCLAYGRRIYEMDFFDGFPLMVPELGIQGVAFVLPASPSITSHRSDRVYLKNMLLSDHVEGLLPEWAFFVRCELNAQCLNPNAAREGLQDDDVLAAARKGLERCLRNYLADLAKHDHARLERLISLHYRAIKLLATDDEGFYRLFIDWLPFETSLGRLPLGKIRAGTTEIVYASTVDTFRQMAPVANAQGICLVNGGYACDTELLEQLPEVFPKISVRHMHPNDMLETLGEVPLEDQQAYAAQFQVLEEILERFDCRIEIKTFDPSDLPALYTASQVAQFRCEIDQTREIASDLWSGLLDKVKPAGDDEMDRACLCLNWRNSVVQRLLKVKPGPVVNRAVELLYVQALLQGHFPLGPRERRVLGEGVTGLINLALQVQA